MPFLNLPSPTISSLGDNNILRLLVGSGTQPFNRFEGVSTALEFFQTIKDYGLSTKNRFFTVMNCPSVGLPPQFAQRLGLFCKSASFPESTIDNITLDYIPSMGEKVATNYNFSDAAPLSLSFYCSMTMFERRFFEIWQSAVSNPRTQMMNFYDEYAKPNEITVIKMPRGSGSVNDAFNYRFREDAFPKYQLSGRSRDPLQDSEPYGMFYAVKFYECYPIKISGTEFSYGGSDLVEFTVDIAYKYYRTPITFDIGNYQGISDSDGPLDREYAEKLRTLLYFGNMRGGGGLVENSMDKIAKTINGIVVPITNVANSITQNF